MSLLCVGWSRGRAPFGRLGEKERAASDVESAQESAAGAADSPMSSTEAEAAAQESAIPRRLFTIASNGDNKNALDTNMDLRPIRYVMTMGDEVQVATMRRYFLCNQDMSIDVALSSMRPPH